MSAQNPYSTPSSTLDTANNLSLEVITGQKQANYVMLAYIGVFLIGYFLPGSPLVLLLGLAVFVTTLFVTVKLSRALGSGWIATLLRAILIVVPFVGLLVIGSWNSRATKRLKSEGYDVGFMGVRS